MSQIVAYCPSCQKKYRIDERIVGKVLKCKSCQTMFAIDPPEIPAAESAAVPPRALPNPPQVHLPPQGYPAPNHPNAPPPHHPPQGYPSPYPNDPLAMPPGGGNYIPGQAPQQPPVPGPPQYPYPANAGPAANWKKSVEQHDSNQALSGGDRAMILMGAFLFIIAIVVNMLPLLGTQVPLFRGKGTLGPLIGLIMGLCGAGLLAGGLRHFKMASIISGSVGGAFIALIFVLSVVAGREKNNTLLIAANDKGQGSGSVLITNASGPWYKAYPEWTGFTSQIESASIADQWNPVNSYVSGISASFPGAAQPKKRTLRIGSKNATVNEMESRYQQQVFRLGTFVYPEFGKTANEILDAVQKTIGNVSKVNSNTVQSFPAREFNGRTASRGQHGVIVVVGETIVILQCEGVSTLVPGEISNKLLASLVIDPSAATDRRDESADALDPFLMDGSPPPQQPESSPKVSRIPGPEISLSNKEERHEKEILDYIGKIEREMAEGIHLRSTVNFAPHYLTVSAGEDSGQRRFLASHDKSPIIGVDFVLTRSGSTHAFTSIVPVYDKSKQTCELEARPGYALSGIRVNASSHVEGIKFVFSKITDKGFDNAQSYESQWYGTPAAGIGKALSGDGRPVYGFWMCKGQSMRSIGLIRERQ